jgi:hypothetical protein
MLLTCFRRKKINRGEVDPLWPSTLGGSKCNLDDWYKRSLIKNSRQYIFKKNIEMTTYWIDLG